VVAIDTVGFIQRIPTSLIASFRSTLEEISEATGLKVTDIEKAEEWGNRRVEEVSEHLKDTTILPDLEAKNNSDREWIEKLLKRLKPKEAKILKDQFGWDGEIKTLAEAARELGITRERARQLANRGMEQLRATAKTDKGEGK
jgi:DNA-directed RNA polymerase sigma subunit (sigma70/sigma32)